jgi:hypothetical protein
MTSVLRKWSWLFIPFVVASLFFMVNLSRLPLEDADEATYALVAQDLYADGAGHASHFLAKTG